LDCINKKIMSSKAEKTPKNSPQHQRLSICFRNPVLLKLLAWLGGLSAIFTTGMAWAELQPLSAAKQNVNPPTSIATQVAANSLATANLPVTTLAPTFTVSSLPAPATSEKAEKSLTSRAVSRPAQAQLLTADNYTVGTIAQNVPVSSIPGSIEIPVPRPLTSTIPVASNSRVKPKFVSNTAARTNAPLVAVPTPIASGAKPQPITLQPVTVPPMKPVAVSVPRAGRDVPSQTIQRVQPIATGTPVPSVSQLPKVNAGANVPTVKPLPSVTPTANTGRAIATPTATNNTGAAGYISANLIYPLSSPAPTTSRFGWRTHPITGSRRFHSGVDIGAPMGAPVVAAATGTVVTSGWLGGYGKTIVIQHNGVQQTLYGHLSEIFVQKGQTIEQGTVIGRVGSTGNSTGPHLHFESRVSTNDGWVAVDPGEDIKYALENLRQAMPTAQRDLPAGF
jgi:murein DD-endopeptidase MepM/ murein hydrolase activator NlpD